MHNYPHDYLANYMLGFLASEERRYPEADHYLSIAAQINPEAPEPPLYMGLNAYAQDNAKRAEAMLRKAVILTGKDEARSNYQIRRAYVDLGAHPSENRPQRRGGRPSSPRPESCRTKLWKQSQQRIASIATAGGAGTGAAVVSLVGSWKVKPRLFLTRPRILLPGSMARCSPGAS